MSALAGAEFTTISDYPSPAIIHNIEKNVNRNLHDKGVYSPISVQGHQWGMITDDFSQHHAHSFTRILCADCLWMDGEHENLLCSLQHFLAPEATACIIAGFHTGRAIVVSFFDKALKAGFEFEKMWEQDHYGEKRPWDPCRKDCDNYIDERSKWLVIAILMRRQDTAP